MNSSEISNALILEIRSLEPDIRDSDSIFYGDLEKFYTSTGRSSYLEKGFLKAALPILFKFSDTYLFQDADDVVLLQEIKDNKVVADYSKDRLRHELPIAEKVVHNYNVRRISGTVKESYKRICSGRKAEKYFISFLTDLGFRKNQDFFDVANNKNYGYDVRFFDVGLEIKNIKNGYFFLSDNEIARLENTSTHLILVDIDNGIWFLKNNSKWLSRTIDDIKKLRNYCKDYFSNLDPSDIKIIIDDNVKNYVTDISDYSRELVMKTIVD